VTLAPGLVRRILTRDVGLSEQQALRLLQEHGMKSINVHYHVEGGAWWADSPDLPGWTAAGDSFDEVRAQALAGARHFAGEPIAVSEMLPQSEAG
jgi:hypothetical protein